MKSDIHHEMLRVALRRGESMRKDRGIRLHGRYNLQMSFAGPSPTFDGSMYCYSSGARIVTINFTEGLITTRDTRHQRVRREIHHWTFLVFEMFNLKSAWQYLFWVSDGIHDNAFAARMPWCRRIDNCNWFHWPSFNYDRAEEYFLSTADLRHNQHWRWFKYGWDDEGQWSRQFIDKDAERRWRARERKKNNDLQRSVHGTSP